MKYILFITSLFLYTLVYGQCRHDKTIKDDAFFKTIESVPYEKCRIHSVYFDEQDKYFGNEANLECYLLQKQIKDSLRVKFNDEELFDIAQYSRIPFFRIAAFELYSQTNYPKHKVIQFLKRGKMPGYNMYLSNDTTAETYDPLNPIWPVRGSVRLKMLEIIDPAAKQRPLDSTGRLMAEVPKHPKSKKLDLETFVSVYCYINQYCMEAYTTYSWVGIKLGQKPKTPTFNIPYPLLDFGTIDLNYLDSTKRHFELRGAIKVINNTSQSITLNGQFSAHTMCTKDKYVIPPKKETIIEFKSLVELNRPFIDRTITLTNVKTGGTQVFKFKAKFIHTRE